MRYRMKITGDVSVEQCEPVTRGGYWILGPTGAGKSSFIEALSGEGQSLGISKDQLAGFTQEVTAYKVKNAMVQFADDVGHSTYTLYLIDTPGFSDSKISELEIITKVKQWMKDHDRKGINGVLYLSPITDTRIPGSKRQTIKMIQSLLWNKAFHSVNIVTTMWDRLGNPQAKKHAEARFAQLRKEIWKGPIGLGAKISRYHNNFDSAIQILRDIINSKEAHYALLDIAPIKRGDASAPLLYKELLDRISNARQEKELLQQDKIQLISKPDPQLELEVLSRLPGVKRNLAKFLGQLVAFGNPPHGFERVIPEQWLYQNLLDQVNEAWEEQAVLKAVLTNLQMDPDPVRDATLRRQLNLVERELLQHAKRLVMFGAPKGCEKDIERTIERLLQTPPSSNAIPNVITADSSIGASAHPTFSSHAAHTTPIVARNVSISAQGSVSPRGYLQDHLNKGFRSFKDKLTFGSRREDPR